jgi:hypothetical protein
VLCWGSSSKQQQGSASACNLIKDRNQADELGTQLNCAQLRNYAAHASGENI